MALTDTRIRNLKPAAKPKKVSDGGGLHLLITPQGSRLWRLAYRFAGKQKTLAIGAYPRVSLEDAREARMAAKKLIADGVDPGAAKKEAKRQQKLAADNTFRAIGEEWLEKQRREGRAEATLKKNNWLLGFAYSVVGHRPIAQISSAEVLDVLRRVERRGKLESARRLRSTMGGVFRYAIATARAENDPTVALRGALTAPTVKHRAAITEPKAFGALLRAIDDFDGQPATKAALKLMAILFPRPGELRAAKWSEVDLDIGVWTIPAARTKVRREHRVPLPSQAVGILQSLRDAVDSEYIFPSIRSVQRPMSANTLNAALRRLGYSKEEVSAHGFRATASTLLNESGLWSADVIERQLAHVEHNQVRRAYSRADYWQDRVVMMDWWANHLEELQSDKVVVALDRKRAF